jgi:hypothetical protein
MAHSKVKDELYAILREAEQEAISVRQGTKAAGGSDLKAQADSLQVLIANLGQAMYLVADALGVLMPDPVLHPFDRRRFGDRVFLPHDG